MGVRNNTFVPPAEKRQEAALRSGRSCRYFVAGFLLGMLMLTVGAVQAEQYLTVDEVQRICFPEATRFEIQQVRLSKQQMESIQKLSRVKVSNPLAQFRIAYSGDRQTGVLITDRVYGKHELIDFAVALSPDGAVLHVEIMEYRERYGAEIRSSKWRAQFSGKTVGSPLKLNEDLYNISGATISCRNVSDGVKRLLATYQVAGRNLLSATTGVSGNAALARQ